MWPWIAGKDRRDGLLRFESGLVLVLAHVIDGDVFEQCPVEHQSLGGFGVRVDLADVGEELEDRVEADLRVVVGRLERVEPADDGLETGADAVLFGPAACRAPALVES